MSIKIAEKVLFEEWQRSSNYQYFVSDGLFDETTWNQQKLHILYVLKEANWENENVDLCEYLLSEKSSTYWKTWNNIARWSKALLEEGEYPSHVSKADKTYWLRRIAYLNLKKVGGDAVAEDATICEYATRDATFIRRQIQLYNPDIIICCGRGEGKNADLLHDVVLEHSAVSDWKDPIMEYNYFIYSNIEKRVPVVSFYHPQMRGDQELFCKRYMEMVTIGKYLKEHYINA